jgi:hypothetical protein
MLAGVVRAGPSDWVIRANMHWHISTFAHFPHSPIISLNSTACRCEIST